MNANLFDVIEKGRRRLYEYILELSAVIHWANRMKSAAKPDSADIQIIHLLPRWATSMADEAIETVAFSTGAALAVLDIVLRDPSGRMPAALMRDRLALDAAAACRKLEGRAESVSDIRDAVCLARAGEALGPAGDMFEAWRKMARINLRASSWRDRLMKSLPDQVADVVSDYGAQSGSPVAQAAQMLGDVLQRFPREEAAALVLADVILARALGWDRPIPLLAAHLKRADVRAIAAGESDALLPVHRAVITGCDTAVRSAADLSRRAAKLEAIAPKLRAKGASKALAVFLSHDAVSPSGMLSPMIQGSSFAMTDRAARRLCDRLVDLGAVRELTGRPTFRLYGL